MTATSETESVSTSLKDAEHREIARLELDKTLIVEAGAGTGKTTVLVDRVVALIASGRAPIEKIAAITFTEAAAAEMRSRVREAVEHALGLDESDGEIDALGSDHGESPETVKARLTAALGNMHNATISTIHAFAQSILATHPLQAELPPRFRIADPLESAIDFRERWNEFKDELYESDEFQELTRVATLLGVRSRDIEKLASEFHDNWDRLDSIETKTRSVLPAPDSSVLIRHLTDLIDSVSECSAPDTDRLAQHIFGLIPFRDALIDAEGDSLIDMLAHAPSISPGNAGVVGNWGAGESGKETKKRIGAIARSAEGALSDALTPLRLEVVHQMSAALAKFTLDSARRRRADGRLEFHDLLVLCRNVLRDDPEVRRLVRAKYACLLVDEFQDTDPLQVEICALIAAPDGDCGGADWFELEADDGRLFIVGDPKQAIYRFRRADIGIYMKAKTGLGAGGGGSPPVPLALTSNFRSHDSVINWVNLVFDRYIGRTESDDQPRYVDLETTVDSGPDGDSRVWVLGGGTELKAADVRYLESESIAKCIAAIKGQHWQVNAGRESAQSPVRYQDIQVLIRARTSLPSLEDAFSNAGIPYLIEARSLVFESQDVRDLLAVVAAVVDPSDDVGVVAALRSAAFGCTDADLLEYVQLAGRTNVWGLEMNRPAAVPADHPVAEALDCLRSYRNELAWKGSSALLEQIVADRMLFEKSMPFSGRRDSWRRLRYVTDQCRAFAESGGGGLADFLDWVRRQEDEGAYVGEALLADPDEDAVRVTTIHGSKGLEYPVVIVAGIGYEPRSNISSVMWGSDVSEIRLGKKENQIETLRFDEASKREAEQEKLETARLMYVAATRAKDHMIVSLFHANRKASAAATITEYLEAGESPARDAQQLVDWADENCDDRPESERVREDAWNPPDPAARLASEAGAREAEWVSDRLGLIRGAQRTPMHGATSIIELVEADLAGGRVGGADLADAIEVEPVEMSDSHPWRRGRAGTEIGRAVHGVLQVIDLATGDRLEALCRDQAAAEGIEHLLDEVIPRVRSALLSSAVRAAVAAGDYWREVFVGSMVAQGAGIEGYIDLLYRSPEGLVVVDYKTDSAATKAEAGKHLERYKYQGAAYAAAIRRATGESVTKCTFVFTNKDGPVEEVIENLPEVDAELMEILERAGAPAG